MFYCMLLILWKFIKVMYVNMEVEYLLCKSFVFFCKIVVLYCYEKDVFLVKMSLMSFC